MSCQLAVKSAASGVARGASVLTCIDCNGIYELEAACAAGQSSLRCWTHVICFHSPAVGFELTLEFVSDTSINS